MPGASVAREFRGFAGVAAPARWRITRESLLTPAVAPSPSGIPGFGERMSGRRLSRHAGVPQFRGGYIARAAA